jgi:hypothetical protein
LEAVEQARKHGVISHATHRLQNFGAVIFKSLEIFNKQSVNKWLRSNSDQCVILFHVSSLLSEKYDKTAAAFKTANRFRGQLDLGLLAEACFLQMTSFPVEI